MRSFLSSNTSSAKSSFADRSRAVQRPGRSFWHKQSGAVAIYPTVAVSEAEAALRALLCRSEAFAEDLGPGYDGLRFLAQPAAAR